jgi:hypothetical protein
MRDDPHALYLNQTLYGAYVTDVIEKLAKHVGVVLAGDAFERICARVIGDFDRESARVLDLVLRDFPLAKPPGEYVRTYSSEEQSIIADTVNSFGQLIDTRTKTSIVCRPEIVPDRDNPELLLSGPRDMLGPARVMFGGHMIHLPIGLWKARIVLEVAENFSGNQLISQVYVGSELLEQVAATLPVSGVFQYEMDFRVSDSFFPVQVLVGIGEGAIEGKLLLRAMTLDMLEKA